MSRQSSRAKKSATPEIGEAGRREPGVPRASRRPTRAAAAATRERSPVS